MDLETGASAKPDIVAMNDLLDAVTTGEYRIPKFQRPYVWRPDDMLQLFDSIVRGYPIGSLLVWQTERSDISSLDSIGPIAVPETGPVLRSYVVDGHQRLATLLGVLRLPAGYPNDRPDEWRWWIAFDLRAQTFIHMKGDTKSIPLHVLPLRSILRTVDFARRTREIVASTSLSESEIGYLLDRADAVQRSIRDYRIPLTVMRSASLDDAVNIFARVNQLGRVISSDQMLSALTYREGVNEKFDLAASIDEILGELRPFGFSDIDRSVILRIIIAHVGADFTRPSFENLLTKRTMQELRDGVARARDAALAAAAFLNEDIGLKTSRLLPYSSIFVLLSIFFGHLRIRHSQIGGASVGALKKWFWGTSFNGWFAGANTTDLRDAAEDMRRLADGVADAGDFEARYFSRPVRPFPMAYDRRSARIRASLLMQINRVKPLDPLTRLPVDGNAIFASAGTADIPYFFTNRSRPEVSSPANRVILPKSYARGARLKFLEVADHQLGAEVLESHLVTPSALHALRLEDCKRFVAEREAAILAAEISFLQSLGVPLDEHGARAREEVDSDT